MSQSHLCYDIDAWVPNFFQSFWDEVPDLVPSQMSSTESSRGWHARIDDDEITSIITDVRQALHATNAEYSNDDHSRHRRALWTYLLARLHHAYLDAAAALAKIPPSIRDQRTTQIRLRAFFALASHWHRTATRAPV